MKALRWCAAMATVPAITLSTGLAFAGGQAHEEASTQDPVSQLIVAAILLAMFVGLVRERAHRVLVALSCVVAIFSISYLTPYRLMTFGGAMTEAEDWNVVFLLAAMMAIVGVLKETNVFPWSVSYAIKLTRGKPNALMAVISHLTGFLSAFADNVTTVLFVTPMASRLAHTLKMNPWAILMPVIMAANIGGTATLIGDPPNIMIGSAARLDFMDFIINLTPPVVVMMIALEWISARYYAADIAAAVPVDYRKLEEVQIRNPELLRWSLIVVAFVFVGFATHGITHMPVAVPAMMGAGIILWLQDHFYLKTHKPTLTEREHGILHVMEREIEWPVLVFFVCLFAVVGAAVSTGLMAQVAEGLRMLLDFIGRAMGLSPQGTLLVAALVILLVSAVASAFLDNIPYTLVAIPVVAKLTEVYAAMGLSVPDVEVLWWALALGACLGGNGTLTGASANLTVVGIAEKGGDRISFIDFAKFGAVVVAITVGISVVFLCGYVLVGDSESRIGWSIAALLLVAWKCRNMMAFLRREQ